MTQANPTNVPQTPSIADMEKMIAHLQEQLAAKEAEEIKPVFAKRFLVIIIPPESGIAHVVFVRENAADQAAIWAESHTGGVAVDVKELAEPVQPLPDPTPPPTPPTPGK